MYRFPRKIDRLTFKRAPVQWFLSRMNEHMINAANNFIFLIPNWIVVAEPIQKSDFGQHNWGSCAENGFPYPGMVFHFPKNGLDRRQLAIRVRPQDFSPPAGKAGGSTRLPFYCRFPLDGTDRYSQVLRPREFPVLPNQIADRVAGATRPCHTIHQDCSAFWSLNFWFLPCGELWTPGWCLRCF